MSDTDDLNSYRVIPLNMGDYDDQINPAPEAPRLILPIGSFDFLGGAYAISRKKSKRNVITLSALGAVAALVVGYGFYLGDQAKIINNEATIVLNTNAVLSQQIAKSVSAYSGTTSLKSIVSQIQSAKTSITATLAQEPAYVAMITALNQAAGSQVSISALSFAQPSGPNASGTLTLNATTSTYASLAAWSQALSSLPFLTSVSTSFSGKPGTANSLSATTTASLTSSSYSTTAATITSKLNIPPSIVKLLQG